MNRFFIAALVLLVGSTALRNQIGDGPLSIGIGLGVACVLVGLFEMYGKKKA
jgi:hypothetical protein